MEHLGAIAPGYIADMVLTDDLRTMWAKAVFFEGQLAAEDGRLIAEIEERPLSWRNRNSMNVGELSLGGFLSEMSVKTMARLQ